MSHVTRPPPGELPSPRRLRRATLMALATAVILVVVIVLPAERGIDPTGLGRIIGLTEMGEVKMDLAAEMAADSAVLAVSRRADSVAAADSAAVVRAVAMGEKPARSDTTTVIIGPNQERAIRLRMRAKAWAIYSWSAGRGSIDYDIRGDSVNATEQSYHRYGSGSGLSSKSGVLVAVFDGLHGWYWRNNTDSVIAIRLVTSGGYTEISVH